MGYTLPKSSTVTTKNVAWISTTWAWNRPAHIAVKFREMHRSFVSFTIHQIWQWLVSVFRTLFILHSSVYIKDGRVHSYFLCYAMRSIVVVTPSSIHGMNVFVWHESFKRWNETLSSDCWNVSRSINMIMLRYRAYVQRRLFVRRWYTCITQQSKTFQ